MVSAYRKAHFVKDVWIAGLFGTLTTWFADWITNDLDFFIRPFLIPGILQGALMYALFYRPQRKWLLLIFLPLAELVYLVATAMIIVLDVPGSLWHYLLPLVTCPIATLLFSYPAILCLGDVEKPNFWWGIVASLAAGVVFLLKPPGVISIVLSLYTLSLILSLRMTHLETS